MATEYCTVCGCVVPFCKHTEVKAGPWLRVCITPFGTHIADALYMESVEMAIEHCKATLKLNPEYTRVQLHEGETSTTPVVWDSIDQEMAEAAMMMSGVDPAPKPARKKAEYKMRSPQIIPCTTLRPDRQDMAGKFVAEGFVAYNDDDGKLKFQPNKTRTSMLVKVDIEAGYIETLNSIYRIV